MKLCVSPFWNKGVPLLRIDCQFLIVVDVTTSQLACAISALPPEERPPVGTTSPLICDEGDIDPRVFSPAASTRVRRWISRQKGLPYHSYLIALCSSRTDPPTGDNVVHLDNLH